MAEPNLLTDTDQFPEQVRAPGTGERATEATFARGLQDVADRTRYLKNRLGPTLVTDLPAAAPGIAGQVRWISGREAVGDGGEGWFVWRSGDQSAGVTADPQRGVYVAPASDPSGVSGAWVRVITDFVKVEWFGAKGDAVRPSDSTGLPTGTDDTAAVAAARDFLQTIAFQPNFFVGDWGGLRLEFTANKAYRLTGHNPLGTSRPRSTTSNDAGSLARQNWRIEGNGCLLLWTVQATDDALIESHETFVRQLYKDFSVVPCGLSGAQGWLYKNTANPGRNATSLHKFEGVQVQCVGSSANSATIGLKGLFRYEGTNLGDRLQTDRCRFAQFEVAFYSENLEAVSQRFVNTSFGSYIDGAVVFHIRRHGSGFSASGCELLCKGNHQTLLKTEYLPGLDTGSNGANFIGNIRQCRLELTGGHAFTLVDAEFGMIDIADLTMAPGGLPSAASESLIVRGSAVVTVTNCHLYGRVVMGAPLVTNYLISRRYQLMLKNCLFSMDLSQCIDVIGADGTTRVPLRSALIEPNIERPAILVEDTNGRSINWQGLTTDTDRYVFDGVYLGTNWPQLNPHERTVLCGRYRSSAQRWYLDRQNYFVLPGCCTITSIRLTRLGASVTHADELRISVGSATYVVPLDNEQRRNEEILAPNAIVISDVAKAERLVSLDLFLGGVQVASPSLQGFLEITYRQALGLNEIDTAEVGGVRPTRVVTAGDSFRSLNEPVASGASTANIDIPVPAQTRVLYEVEARSESSGGARATVRSLVETMRSGFGAPTTPTVVSQFTAGTGLTLNASISGNSLRLNVTNGHGEDATVTTRVWRIDKSATVEDT